jgi:hypothetical protein
MLLTLILAALPTLAASPVWADVPELPGTEYVGRSGPDGQLMIAGWRSDGGTYVSDDVHALAFISNETRVGVMTDAFRQREADGAAAWTVKAAMSIEADRNTVYVDTNCSDDPAFDPYARRTTLIIGIVPTSAPSANGRVSGLRAAARIDLVSGAIEPIADPSGISCVMEEPN